MRNQTNEGRGCNIDIKDTGQNTYSNQINQVLKTSPESHPYSSSAGVPRHGRHIDTQQILGLIHQLPPSPARQRLIQYFAEITIDGDEVTEITIDGEDVQEVTIDGEVVWTSELFIDDFERGNLDPYGGETNNWKVDTQHTLDGNYSLRSDTGDNSFIGSTSGLPYYPQRGDTIVYKQYIGDSEDYQIEFCFLVNDESWHDNGYSVYFNPRWSGSFTLRRWDDGDSTVLDGFGDLSSKPSGEQWLDFRIQLKTNGDIIVDAWEEDGTQIEGTIQANDSTYDYDGIGFRDQWGSGVSQAWFPYIKIED